MSALRKPVLHFLLLGGLLFLGKQWWPAAMPAGADPIRVSPAELERIRGVWARETGSAPDAKALDASLRRYADEEILLREALRLGLDDKDPVARERLVLNMRFALGYADEAQVDDGALLEQARTLGMNRRDLVVRRRLIQVMEMRIVSGAVPTEKALRAHVAAHPERYGQGAQLGFRQVFVSAERADAASAAASLLGRLRSGAAAVPAGDPFLLGNVFAPQTHAQLAKNFGGEFADALARMPEGAWSGPLRSVYGLHLVRVEQRIPAQAADFARVRDQAAYALLPEREAQTLRETLERLRERYPLEVASSGSAEAVTP